MMNGSERSNSATAVVTKWKESFFWYKWLVEWRRLEGVCDISIMRLKIRPGSRRLLLFALLPPLHSLTPLMSWVPILLFFTRENSICSMKELLIRSRVAINLVEESAERKRVRRERRTFEIFFFSEQKKIQFSINGAKVTTWPKETPPRRINRREQRSSS